MTTSGPRSSPRGAIRTAGPWSAAARRYPLAELGRRLRLLAALSGVDLIAGWHGDQLRVYRPRAFRFFARVD
jgi:hypothetical protein